MEKEELILRQPYIVNIENPTDNLVEKITIFFSYSALNEKFNSVGDLEKNGLIISSIKDVSYKQILEHFCSSKIRIGLTKITSETENNNRNWKYHNNNTWISKWDRAVKSTGTVPNKS
jgi:hypothetical protein